ncbi:imidazole glycerol phosphate synthase subunit HisH [Marinicellulosiphila megalodicopiae]|uniref:imidazole glycerol phosphate synthase subunit HisH n=1 Tax=Marinicellulosiphila megalodicopiae TaxID=2724896 RepID=UPI003BB0E9EC
MNQTTVAVIDYGMGNLHSVGKAIEKVAPNAKLIITNDHDTILNATHVILPGVGAMRDCMGEMIKFNVDKIVHEVIKKGTPFLGICVGMQALLNHSQENNGVNCLSVFEGDVVHFDAGNDVEGRALKIPHMGWNQVKQTQKHPLWNNIEDNTRFYYVHTYHAHLKDNQYLMGQTTYGEDFCAVIAKDNVFATQFHPEKSHDAGLQLLKNFVNWNGKV